MAFLRIRLGPDEEVTSKHVNAVQDNIASAFKDLSDADNVVSNVKLNPSGINHVAHKLGRKLVGWEVARTHGTGTFVQVWDVQDSNTSPHLQLYLMASATGTFDLRVF